MSNADEQRTGNSDNKLLACDIRGHGEQDLVSGVEVVKGASDHGDGELAR